VTEAGGLDLVGQAGRIEWHAEWVSAQQQPEEDA